MRAVIQMTLVVLLALSTSCSWFRGAEKSQRLASRMLTRESAELRSELISNIAYSHSFDLREKKSFSGTTQILFDLKSPKTLTLDFSSGEVISLSINGRGLSAPDYNQFFVVLPKSYLKAGANTVRIEYKHKYSRSGVGLYRFEDPEDGASYLYTQFEPYDANFMFPCFDQPDLKARYETVVIAPSNWEVVTATAVATKSPIDPEATKWSFPQSDKFSTYIYSLAAGPYHIWEAVAQTDAHAVPLRLLARKSLAKYVQPEEWFDVTRQGLRFFENYFDYPYPYKKYDQVLVPDFNFGAMENVANVIISERFLSRGKKTYEEKLDTANLVLHEMAHMWFGNLVTMKWWDDLWLNESFATYTSLLAQAAATPYKDAWVYFLSSDKESAYWEDQLVTTHPILNHANDTSMAFANFDGITYGKGASALKQLSFFIGPKNFQKGLQSYFKKYANSNTTLREFIRELEISSQKNLTAWRESWLETDQVNTIQVTWACEGGVVTEAILRQTAPQEHPELRPHQTLVGVFSQKGKQLQLAKSFAVTYSAAETPVAELLGMNCRDVDLVELNLSDHDYAKVLYDKVSLQTIRSSLSSIEDPIQRMSVWASLWQMVVGLELSVPEYVDILLMHTTDEKNASVLSNTLNKMSVVAVSLLPETKDWQAKRNLWLKKISNHLWRGMKASATHDLQTLWFAAFVRVATRPEDLKRLEGMLKDQPAWLKAPLDQDQRWKVVQALQQNTYVNAEKLIEVERAKDSSSMGKQNYLVALSLNPDTEKKLAMWEDISQGPKGVYNLGELRPVLQSFFGLSNRRRNRYARMGQSEVAEALTKPYYEALAKDLSGFSMSFVRELASAAPVTCSEGSQKAIKKFLESQEGIGLPPALRKELRIRAQEDERCIAIRKHAQMRKAI